MNTVLEITTITICLFSLAFIASACDESSASYDRAMAALVSGPPAPSLQGSDELVNALAKTGYPSAGGGSVVSRNGGLFD